ncbi:MAG: hybrid sensor histidine kinase/response regulator [Myxococcota bacterium]
MSAIEEAPFPGLVLTLDRQARVVRCDGVLASGIGDGTDPIGHPVSTLVTDGAQDALDAAVRACLRRGIGTTVQVPLRTCDPEGERRFRLSIAVRQDGDGLIVKAWAVSRFEDASRGDDRFDRLFENAQEALFVIRNDDGTLTRVNPALCRLLGCADYEILGQRFASFIAAEDRKRVLDNNRRRVVGDPTLPETYPLRVLPVEGEPRLCQFRAQPFVVPGHVVGSIVDLSGMRAPVEEALGTLQREGLVDMARALTHDFNNVLGSILGFTELMESRLDRPEALPATVDAIKQAVRSGQRLTERLRILARPVASEQHVVDVNRLVREGVAQVRGRADTRLSVVADLADEQVRVLGDPHLVAQIILNLLGNAVDATQGPGEVRVATSLLEGHASEPGRRRVRLRVEDTGHGIPRHLTHRVLQPFFTTRRAAGRRGLGLAVVDDAVRSLGGSMDLESTPGRGTSVTVELPAHQEGASAARPSSEGGRSEDRASGRRVALVADDNRGIRSLITAALQEQGLEVLSVPDGEAAAEALEELSDSPTVCVLDVVMPGRDGLAVARLARHRFPATRIVVVSGHPEPTDPVEDERAYDVYLSKPFRLADLLRAAGLSISL